MTIINLVQRHSAYSPNPTRMIEQLPEYWRICCTFSIRGRGRYYIFTNLFRHNCAEQSCSYFAPSLYTVRQLY